MMTRRRYTVLSALACLVVVGATVGCSGGSPSDDASVEVASTTTPTTQPTARPATPTQTPTPTKTPPPEHITLAFGGDVHFENHVRGLLNDPAHSLESLKDTFGKADFAMVNLETAVTERGTPIPGKKYTFRTSTAALDALASAGFDAVSLANNHGADYGAEGLADTVAAKKTSPIPMVGIGADENEAFAPATVDIKGVKAAIFGSSQLLDATSSLYSAKGDKAGIATNYDTTRLRQAIRAAKETHDITVVYLHWGTERTVCPDERQLRVAAELAEEGPDIVVGGHAHRPQGAGWMGPMFVAYGLGNFIWYRSDEPNSHAGALTLTVDVDAVQRRKAGEDVGSVVTGRQWTPMLIGRDGIPRVQDSATSSRLLATWEKAVQCSKLSAEAPTGD